MVKARERRYLGGFGLVGAWHILAQAEDRYYYSFWQELRAVLRAEMEGEPDQAQL